jgi:WhiB family redox-sensing transcriptional regulator
LIPLAARPLWITLADVLHVYGAAPCEVVDDPEAWWPVRGDEPAPSAVAACEACPARRACLDYAVAADERAGVWDGLTASARRALPCRAAA